MKNFYVAALSVILFSFSFVPSSSILKNKKVNTITNAPRNMVILELFTSQGCITCPPADKLMGTYTSSKNIIPLSFHVDYWDRLGWKDPYSSKEYTRRQSYYSAIFHSRVYTPQLVINGKTEMLGSNAPEISATIKEILTERPEAGITIDKAVPDSGKLNIGFTVSGNSEKSVLNIAIVEKKTVTPVKAGENGGATLTDFNVVREFETLKKFEKGKNEISIVVPPAFDLKKMSLILFLQKRHNRPIIAADKIDL